MFGGFSIKTGLVRCAKWITSSAGIRSTGFSRIASTLFVDKLISVASLRMIPDVSQSTADILKLEKG